MATPNIEVVRRGIAAFNARDVEALIQLFDPEIEMRSAFAAGVGGPSSIYRGHEGVRSWHRDLEETWAEILLEPEEYCERGDQVLVYYRMSGRGRQSGVEVAMQVAHLMAFRDGSIVRLRTYAERDAALREAGVAEEELAPLAT